MSYKLHTNLKRLKDISSLRFGFRGAEPNYLFFFFYFSASVTAVGSLKSAKDVNNLTSVQSDKSCAPKARGDIS